MSAVDCLRQNGAMEAVQIARMLGWRLEAVYLELVAAETAGRAWIEIEKLPCSPWRIRRWVAV